MCAVHIESQVDIGVLLGRPLLSERSQDLLVEPRGDSNIVFPSPDLERVLQLFKPLLYDHHQASARGPHSCHVTQLCHSWSQVRGLHSKASGHDREFSLNGH